MCLSLISSLSFLASKFNNRGVSWVEKWTISHFHCGHWIYLYEDFSLKQIFWQWNWNVSFRSMNVNIIFRSLNVVMVYFILFLRTIVTPFRPFCNLLESIFIFKSRQRNGRRTCLVWWCKHMDVFMRSNITLGVNYWTSSPIDRITL